MQGLRSVTPLFCGAVRKNLWNFHGFAPAPRLKVLSVAPTRQGNANASVLLIAPMKMKISNASVLLMAPVETSNARCYRIAPERSE